MHSLLTISGYHLHRTGVQVVSKKGLALAEEDPSTTCIGPVSSLEEVLAIAELLNTLKRLFCLFYTSSDLILKIINGTTNSFSHKYSPAVQTVSAALLSYYPTKTSFYPAHFVYLISRLVGLVAFSQLL